MNQSRIGSDFDDFLREEKLLEATDAAVVKRVLAFQVGREMKRRQLSKTDMASRMRTSRAAVERLLDPGNTSITLATLGRAAAALGKNLTVAFTEDSRRIQMREPSQVTQRRQQQHAKAASGAPATGRTPGRQASARSKSSRSRP